MAGKKKTVSKKKTSSKKKSKNKYQILVSRKNSYCNGRIKKESLNRARKAYIDDAIKKGKSKSEATKIADRVVNGKCSV